MGAHRWPSCAAFTLLALVLVAGCTATDRPENPAPTSPIPAGQTAPDIPFVAFRDLPPAERAPQQTAPQMTAVAPPGTPDCTPAQVQIVVTSTDVPSQPALSTYRVEATHVSGPHCAIRQGNISVRAVDASGVDLGVDSRAAGERALTGAALLVPDATTNVFLSWRRSSCVSRLDRFRLSLVPGGPMLTTPTVPDPPCLTPETPLTVRAWGHPFTAAGPIPVPSLPPWQVLTGQILPLQDAGPVTVRLTNPSGATVQLRPCPSYQLVVFSDSEDSTIAARKASIDCAAAPRSLGPGASLDLGIEQSVKIQVGPATGGAGAANGELIFELLPYDLVAPIATARLPVRLR